MRCFNNSTVAFFVPKLEEFMKPGVNNLHDVLQRSYDNITLWSSQDVFHHEGTYAPCLQTLAMFRKWL